MKWLQIQYIPKDLGEVIVFAPDEEPQVFTARRVNREWCRSSSDDYAPRDDFYGDNPIKVTHWMRLPQSPVKQRKSRAARAAFVAALDAKLEAIRRPPPVE